MHSSELERALIPRTSFRKICAGDVADPCVAKRRTARQGGQTLGNRTGLGRHSQGNEIWNCLFMKCDRVSQHRRSKSPSFKGLQSFYMTVIEIQLFVRAGEVYPSVHLKWKQPSYLARFAVRARGVATGWRSSD